MNALKIDQLRPTQMTHGVREIREKIKQYEALRGHELEMVIAEKPIPVVYGLKIGRASCRERVLLWV